MSVKCILTNQLSQGELNGYLPLSGGDMAGPIRMNGYVVDLEHNENYFSSITGNNGYISLESYDTATKNSIGFHVITNTEMLESTETETGLGVFYNGKWYDLYHKGYKPIPADIGAVATDTPMTFSINASGGLTVTY